MDEPYENTNQRHDRGKTQQRDGNTKIQKTENEPLAERTSESQDKTSEGQALGGRRPDKQDETSEERALAVRRPDNQDKEERALVVKRPDNQDETSKERALAVRRPDNQDETSKERAVGLRRPDNQDETSKERALAVRRQDNQDETSEEQALAIRRPVNQEQAGIVPFAHISQALQQSASVEQIAGSGNIPILNPTGCNITINQFKDYAQISHHSGHPIVHVPVGMLESAQRESHRTVLPDGGKQTSECSPPEKLVMNESSQRAADLCEAALKSVYKNKGSFIQMIPWVDDDKRHTMDIYTKLELETKEGNPHFSQTVRPSDPKLKSYEDIFVQKTKEGEIVKLTVFNGLPGRGKSTLFDKMAYDWAIGSVPAMQGYKLVVLLKMNALEQSSHLVDAMFDQLLADDVGFEKGDLQSYIEKNPEKVLILLDGFDELITTNISESSFGSILKILNQKMLRGCRALVSTRPSHYDKLVSKQLVQNPFSHIRVLGFGAEEVHEYVHRFYSEERDKAETLLAKIESTNIPSELAQSPMLLLFMCLLWREDSKLPDTMSRLYSEAVKYIFRRKGCVSEEDMAGCVYEIGKVGLKGLLSPKQTLSFREKDFERDDLRLAIKVGILTSQKVLKKLDTHNSVQFVHKTFQEYCSGKYLKRLREVDPAEFQKNLDQIMSLHPENFGFLLRFCCGDSEECTRAVLQLLRARFPDKCSLGSSVGYLAAECYVEGQSAGLVDEEFLHFLIPSHLQIVSLDASTQRFLKCVAEQAKDRGSDCLAKVKEVSISNFYQVPYTDPSIDLTKLLTDLKGCMSAMTNLKGLVFSGYQINEKDEESIVEYFGLLQKLDYVKFSQCFGFSKGFGSNIFKAVNNLHTLALVYCLFPQQDIQNVAKSLVDVPNFVELNIRVFKPEGSLELSYIYSHLQKLSLRSYLLMKRDMELVGDAFSGLPNLEELDLSFNNLHDSGALLAFQLQSLKRLQKINLRSCGLFGWDMELIAKAMGSLPNLKELDLSFNDLHSSARLWSVHLRALKHLQKLYVCNCKLSEPDVEHVAESLSDLPDLVGVDLSCNEFLGGSGKLWSVHLKRVKNLDLSACLVEEANMKVFVKTLGHLVKLVELNLSSNDRLGGSAQVWCKYLRHFKNLQLLGLSRCSLNGGGMDQVFGSLCSLRNLIGLDLSGNPCNDSGATWPEQLQLLVYLQRLSLSECSLGGDAMNRILGSLCHLPNLVEVYFRSNKCLCGTASLWSEHLQQFNELQKLDLQDCDLTEDDEKVLRDSLMARGRKGLVITFKN